MFCFVSQAFKFIFLSSLTFGPFCVIRLPVRWDKTVIVLMNEVRVSNPYYPENVSGGTPAANDRVKKVVSEPFLKYEYCRIV